jgi:hypothetical protein
MATIHAWFSATQALRQGSSHYRKPDGSFVNVTRMDSDFQGKVARRGDDIYVGEVTRAEDGGCVQENTRVTGITPTR